MSDKTQTRIIAGIPVAITRKKMKSLRLRVCSQTGMAKVSAPLRVSLINIQAFVTSNLQWITSQQAVVAQQRAQLTPLKDGDSFPFLDRNITVYCEDQANRNSVKVSRCCSNGTPSAVFLATTMGETYDKQQALIERFYRAHLKPVIENIIKEYEPVMGIQVHALGIKKMRTRWGTCNIQDKRVWVNLALAKHPYRYLEYVVVHEMVHLLETHHTPRFWRLVERYLPSWEAAHRYLAKQ